MRFAGFLLSFALTASAADVEFNRDIRPILSDNCYACHGPDANARQANLRLDVRDSALQRGAIVPGDTTKSKLINRIHHAQPALRMPPSYSTKSLSDAQKQLLKQWVEQGAKYQTHWAYNPPQRPEVPADQQPIDHFISRKLAQENLTPVAPADRRTLARRLSLDLTGLPPKPAVVAQFVDDKSPDAYKSLVDKLLASPRYGERMAVYWLDLVRYADTTGFHNDVPYNVYPYRDYVIRAFNENKPFDKFTREQLGGDLMEDPSDEQLTASAYNRLNRLTTEGGAQPKEYLAKYASDRTSTTATVWLGSTLGCAECHDHKFDPFLAKDFYQIAAFFADIEEVGVFGRDGNYGPQHRFLPGPQKAAADRLEAQIAQLRESGKDRFPDTPKNRRALDKYLAKTADWRPLIPTKAIDDCSDPDVDGCEQIELVQEDDGFVRTQIVEGEDKPRETAHTVEIPSAGETLSAVMLEIHPVEDYEQFWLSRFQLHLDGRGTIPLNIRLRDLVADEETDDNPMRDTLEENPHSGWSGKTGEDRIRRAMWVFEQPLETNPGESLRFSLIYNGKTGKAYPGRFRLYATDAAYPELAGDGDRFAEITENNKNWKQIRPLERRRKTLWDRADEVHIAHSVDDPRTMRVLPRGNWMDESGDVVAPQTPGFLGEIPTDERLTRLDLGNWLVARQNPLTARVFVNRMWRLFFGVGLSKTLDDIGSQGEPPSHPELLDWLAVEFMDSGWDVKHLIRTILLSDAYQRSSSPNPELRAADPYNRLFGRQAMFRLDAEFIRDSALQVSGLLNTEMGGPSVKPYQPKKYYVELNFPKREYEPDYNDDQFRRGVYVHWQRTFLHPSMLAFDAPAREECTAERAVSNTPLQSLTLLNDPSYVETARNLAVRMIDAGKGESARINYAFEQAFARPATNEETAILAGLLAEQRQAFTANPQAAEKLIAIGISSNPRSISSTELATWTMAARAILNKHEFITRY